MATFGKLDTQTKRRIAAKFGLTAQAIGKELEQRDAARAQPPKTRSRGARDFAAILPAESVAGAIAADRKYYPDFPTGSFEGEPRLAWIAPDLFRYEPNPDKPFRFVRASGEVIEPGTMLTDGGSIPRALWSVKDLSPWTYAPAFLIHDWLFEQHHAGKTDKRFEEVRDIMLEGVRTLMESGVCERNRLAFDLIYGGIDSFVARRVWDRQ